MELEQLNLGSGKGLRICIATEGLPFNGGSLSEKSLGGSETAALCMARELARRGHKVTVFNRCDREGTHRYEGGFSVDYIDISKFSSVCLFTVWDVVIVSRFAQHLTVPANCGLRVLWLHDVVDKSGPAIVNCLYQTDAIFALSNFHIDDYCNGTPEEGKLPHFREHFWLTNNGIDFDTIKENKWPKEKGKLIFTSRPERGLPYLLAEVFPKILKEVPDAKLYYASYSLDGFPVADQIKELSAWCDAEARRLGPSVVKLGNMSKAELYQQITSAELHLLPSSFPEISPVRGDTLIETPNGQHQIKDLVGKAGFEVYSCDSEGKLSLSKVKGVFKTRDNTKMLKLVCKAGHGRNSKETKTLYLTPDHEVMLRDGTYRKAEDIKTGDRLKVFHRQKNGWQIGYDEIGLTGQEIQPEHRFVYEKTRGIKLGKRQVIHHQNHDTHDCSPDNLELTTHSAHRFGHWDELSEEEFKRETDLRAQCLREWEQHQPEGAISEQRRDIANKLWAKRRSNWSEDAFNQWCLKRASKLKRIYPEDLLDRAVELFESGYAFAQIAGTLSLEFPNEHHIYIPHLFKELRGSGRCPTLNQRQKQLPFTLSNHTVVSIEEAENADAYCMEVDPDHNFVANGIVVHNCISAIEAQACGTPPIATNAFAFKETIVNGKTGILIPGTPAEKEYAERFAQATVMLLKNDKRRKQLSEAGPKSVVQRGLEWKTVAERWEAKFNQMFQERWDSKKDAILLEMERHSDLIAGKKLCEKYGLSTWRFDEAMENLVPNRPKDRPDVQKLVHRYDTIVNRLLAQKVEPKNVLDLECGYTALGLHMATRLTSTNVWLVDSDPKVRAALQKVIVKREDAVQGRVKVLSPEEAQVHKAWFDAVISNDQLELQESPADYFKELATWLNADGHVIFTANFGPISATVKNRPAGQNRLWNLTFADFQAMFSGTDERFSISVIDEGIGVGGDLVGHWMGCMAQKVALAAREFDVEYRRRVYLPYVKLGCAMIAKDASEWIIKCLRHVRPIVDKIHIALDDRTKDTTMSLAFEAGADEVFPVKFDNFSQVRNESIKDLQDMDWILWVDTDEMLINGAKIRRYLHSPFFQGYGLSQRHLMVDVHGTYDVPIRLFRPSKHHKFVGLIHEHCVNVEKDQFGNDPISPSILIPDVDLLHYGYENEAHRRHKCSNRNMELLIRDAKELGLQGRQLTWVLVLRDYLNVAKWRMEKSKRPVAQGTLEYHLIIAAVRTYLQFLSDPKHKYHKLSWDMYQEALAMLGGSGVPFEGRNTPPFEVKLALQGALGGCGDQELKPERIWFIDFPQFLDHISKQTGIMGLQLGLAPPQAFDKILNSKLEVPHNWSVNDIDLLQYGMHNIDQATGRLLKV